MSFYLAKERDKALKRDYRLLERENNLLLKKGQRLKARVEEVEGTMKETLEFVDKLKADLNKANAVKAILDARAKSVKDPIVELQRQV